MNDFEGKTGDGILPPYGRSNKTDLPFARSELPGRPKRWFTHRWDLPNASPGMDGIETADEYNKTGSNAEAKAPIGSAFQREAGKTVPTFDEAEIRAKLAEIEKQVTTTIKPEMLATLSDDAIQKMTQKKDRSNALRATMVHAASFDEKGQRRRLTKEDIEPIDRETTKFSLQITEDKGKDAGGHIEMSPSEKLPK